MRGLSNNLILVLAFMGCFAKVAPCLSAEDRLPAVDSPQFREVRTTASLPKAIIALCADDSGRLAEPGRRWEATDDISNKSLPSHRLIWAAVADGVFIVHYESGGYAHSFHVLLATLDPGETKPRVTWRAYGTSPLKDYAALGPALRAGKLEMQSDRH